MDLQELKKLADDIRNQNTSGKNIFWPKEFKDHAVLLMNSGHSANALFRLTGISVSTIYSWKTSSRQKKKKDFKKIRVVEDKVKSLSLSWDTGFAINGLSFIQLKELLKEGLL